jgi:hypothetical protein
MSKTTDRSLETKDNTKRGEVVTNGRLLEEFVKLLEAHRWEFKQERSFVRMCVLAIGMICALARHTVTQGILAVGQEGKDWTSWYRLFRGERFQEEDLAQRFVEETLKDAPAEEAYVTGVDTTQIPRSSGKMAGSGWLPALRTAIFRRGLHRAQRFLMCNWLPRIEQGYTRAIPIRCLAAFTPKAAAAKIPACKDWEAALKFAAWIRGLLDAAKRHAQWVVLLGDGAFDKIELWRGLPDRVILIVRTAKNRVLRELPGRQVGRGRRRLYGDKAPAPEAHLHDKTGWQSSAVSVRGRTLKMRWKIRGCYLRQTAPTCPVFLLVLGGATWMAGKREPRRRRRDPAFFLIRAVYLNGIWQLPFPAEQILAWVWQRWELEITHRELKTNFGLGQIQCWNPCAAVLSVQWMVWLYGLMTLAGYRAWGWFAAPRFHTAWWSGAKRWSFNTLWRAFRSDLWRLPEFRAFCALSPSSPPNFHPLWHAMAHAASAAAFT